MPITNVKQLAMGYGDYGDCNEKNMGFVTGKGGRESQEVRYEKIGEH